MILGTLGVFTGLWMMAGAILLQVGAPVQIMLFIQGALLFMVCAWFLLDNR